MLDSTAGFRRAAWAVFGFALAIRIAALFPDTAIRYASPDSSLMGSASVRSFGVSRARGLSPSLELRVMAPEHVGWTAGATPTLYWQLSEAADLPLEITLLADTQVEPLIEERRAGPHASGLHSLSLADAELRLEPGVVYRWRVALVVDPQRRSKDLRSAAAVVWKGDTTGPPETPERAHEFAAGGYWYDAFSQRMRPYTTVTRHNLLQNEATQQILCYPLHHQRHYYV